MSSSNFWRHLVLSNIFWPFLVSESQKGQNKKPDQSLGEVLGSFSKLFLKNFWKLAPAPF